MVYVFDSSFVIALTIPDEVNPKIKKMYAGMENEDEKHSPHLLWYEIANVFMNLIRRKRYAYEEFSHFFKMLKAFGLTTDFETGIGYSEKLLHLCKDYNLSSYDAAYLELAERKKAVLCTLDEDLRKAAKKHGVAVI